MLKDNVWVIFDENETYDSVSDIILQKNNIKNYKRYIDNMFINREIDRNMLEINLRAKKVCKKGDNYLKKVDNDFKKWGYTNCLFKMYLYWEIIVKNMINYKFIV